MEQLADSQEAQTHVGPRCTITGEWTDVHIERIQQWANRVINNIWNDPVRRDQFLKKHARQVQEGRVKS